ncbi:hypothetical protein VKT23_001430 [Stygiomarasmius scandens]|uniref:F-box domain-containing protein n=1 Tax=Marasmiellus scandens TaxID=2682957 RepID=A0ABR1JYU4_9AGAR
MERLHAEVIQCIIQELDDCKDQARFRLTCRGINALVEPILYEAIEVSMQGRELAPRSSLLLDTLSGQHAGSRPKRLCRLVRHVKIQSLNPSSKLRHRHSVKTEERVSRRRSLSWRKEKGENGKERTLEEYLSLLGAFKRTKFVTWHIWSKSTEYQTYHEYLFKILGSLPSLHHFTLAVLGSTTLALPSNLHLKGLHSLCIQSPTPSSPAATNKYVLYPLLSVINNSPCLKELHLDFRENHHKETIPPKLEDFLEKVSLSSWTRLRALRKSQLQIESLSLQGWDLDFDLKSKNTKALAHLRHLTGLKIMDPFAAHSNLWEVLGREQVRLKRISVNSVSRPMLEYLESYSGVQCLEVSPSVIRDLDGGDAKPCDDVDHPHLAPRFYQAVKKHEESLTVLSIRGCSKGTWCFGIDNAQHMKNCGRLRELSVYVDSKPGAKEDGVGTLMKMTSQLSSLRVLRLNIAQGNNYFGCALCGAHLDEQPLEVVVSQIQDSIRSAQLYTKPSSRPVIYVEDKCMNWRW